MSSGTDISAMRSRRRTADWDLIYPIFAAIAAEASRVKGCVLLAVLLCATGMAAAQDAAVLPVV
jgi:hypothetical protein